MSAPQTAAVRRPLSGLSVFLPCHNEEGNVERVVGAFKKALPAVAENYEIIVVDDGSRDRTGAIADAMAAADPHVRTVHHQINRGYGGAVTSGMRAARLPYVLLCDGDGQFDVADVSLLAAMVPEYDVVVGRRVRRADHLVRRLNGKAWTLLVHWLFGISIHDIDCGLKLFKREFIQNLELHSRGAMISTELMVRVGAAGAKICEVEVRHLPRQSGEQSGASLRVIVRAFGELLGLYQELQRQRRR